MEFLLIIIIASVLISCVEGVSSNANLKKTARDDWEAGKWARMDKWIRESKENDVYFDPTTSGGIIGPDWTRHADGTKKDEYKLGRRP